MGKFRRYGKLRRKGHRWRKGQSSSSNPETTKFRDAAKRRVWFSSGSTCAPSDEDALRARESTGSVLTSGALQRHNAVLGDDKKEETESREGTFTLGGKTFATFSTFATDWTECTNVSFSRLLSNFRSNNAIQKEQLAVLAAVTEIIKSQNGNETETEYFAALLTTMDVTENEESLTAVVSLLAMVIRHVPSSVLKLKFPETVKSLADLLGKHATSENGLLLKSLIRCLSVLLRVQELSIWNNPSTQQVYDGVLSFTIHAKPNVRRAAQHAVCAILKGSSIMLGDNPLAHHPTAAQTAKFCIHQIRSSSSLNGTTTILHVLTLLKELLGVFPKACVKSVCECILTVMTQGNVMMTSCSMRTLHGLFISNPSKGTLPASLNSQLINALYDYQPSVNDTQSMPAWLTVIEGAYKNLYHLNPALCLGHLPHLFFTCTQLWLSKKARIINCVTSCLRTLLMDCMKPAFESAVKEAHTVFQKIFPTIEACLRYQFHAAWGEVLQILAVMFEIADKACYSYMMECLSTLGQLHNSDNFSFVIELESAVGKAIAAMGPKVVLSAIPLHITGKEETYDFHQSWLLTVLRDNISNTELKFFVEFFIPLATTCLKRSHECSANGNTVGEKSYTLLYLQIWGLLSGFCNSPTDLTKTFKSVAKILGMAISDRKEIRVDVLASLRRLICNNLENTENRTELARFAKNYLPILFNLYVTEPDSNKDTGHQMAVYETVKCYLQITDKGLCNSLFDKALYKVSLPESEKFVKESILDILRIMVPYQDSCRLKQLYDILVPLLVSKDHKMQKKCYRLLEEILSNDAEECIMFTTQNISNFKEVLLKGLSSSALSSKAPRLNCMLHIIRHLELPNHQFLQEVVPEAVLCCKEGNVKVRNSAYMLLIEVGRTLQKWTDKPIEDTVKNYLQLLMAGLAGFPNMVTATLLALARILYEYRNIPSDALQCVCENICLLVTSQTREVVRGALCCIKVLVTSYPTSKTARFLPLVVKSLSSMTENSKRHCRQKLREIFTRLIRKFRYDMVSNLVPKTDITMQKRLKNIRKDETRKKKQWELHKNAVEETDSDEELIIKGKPMSINDILAESDSDEEGKENDAQATRKKQHRDKKIGSAWIQEGVDSVVDFLDPMAAQMITSTRPAPDRVQMKTISHSFKSAPDGRLIITECDDDSDTTVGWKGKKVTKNIDADLEEEEDYQDNLEKPVQSCKRKRSVHGSDSMTEGGPAHKYQAGGTGIHRPVRNLGLKTKKLGNMKTVYGKEYKAKKARGDVKKKGKPDPYAYVPLSYKVLNRRKKAKYAGQFKGLVHAAKKGAARGMKNKLKKTRK